MLMSNKNFQATNQISLDVKINEDIERDEEHYFYFHSQPEEYKFVTINSLNDDRDKFFKNKLDKELEPIIKTKFNSNKTLKNDILRNKIQMFEVIFYLKIK